MKTNHTPEKLFQDLFNELLKELPQIENKIISIVESGFDVKEFSIYLNKSSLTDNQKNKVSKNFSTLAIKNLTLFISEYSDLGTVNFDNDLKEQKLKRIKGLSDLQLPLTILKSLNEPLSILFENFSRLLNNQLALISKYEEENRKEIIERLNWNQNKTDLAYLIDFLIEKKYLDKNLDEICKHFRFDEELVTAQQIRVLISKLKSAFSSAQPKFTITMKDNPS